MKNITKLLFLVAVFYSTTTLAQQNIEIGKLIKRNVRTIIEVVCSVVYGKASISHVIS